MSEGFNTRAAQRFCGVRELQVSAVVCGCFLILIGGGGRSAHAQFREETRLSVSDCSAGVPRILDQIRSLAPGDHRRPDLEHRLAGAYRDCGESLAAEMAYRRYLATLQRTHGLGHAALAPALIELASFYIDQGQPAEAERLIAKLDHAGISSGIPPLEYVNYLLVRGLVAVSHDAFLEADGHFREAWDILRTLPGDHTASIANVHAYLALVNARTGKRQEGIRHAQQGLSLISGSASLAGEAHSRALINLASVHQVFDRAGDAEALLRRAVEIAQESPFVSRAIRARLLQDYARILRRLKRKEEARQAESLARVLLSDPRAETLSHHSVSYQDLTNSARQ